MYKTKLNNARSIDINCVGSVGEKELSYCAIPLTRSLLMNDTIVDLTKAGPSNGVIRNGLRGVGKSITSTLSFFY